MTWLMPVLGVVVLALAGLIIYFNGKKVARLEEELEAYHARDKIEEEAKKKGDEIDAAVAVRRSDVRSWLRQRVGVAQDNDAK